MLQHGSMSPRIIAAILSLLLAPLAHCAMTVGWKVPVDLIAGDLATNEKAHKLAKPPGASAFFQPGDELWDISAAVMGRTGYRAPDPEAAGKEKWPGEWLVWNARSGMIIARGSRADILSAQSAIQVEEQPKVVRTKLELIRGTAGKKDSISVVGRSGEQATMESAPWRIEAAPTLDSSNDLIDEQLKLTWSDGGMQWELSTAVTSHLGERIRIACQGSGEQRWELFLSAQGEYPNGVSLPEVRWQESPDGLACWPIPPGGDRPYSKTPEGFEIGVYRVPPNFLDQVRGGDEKVELPEIEVPSTMAEAMRGKVVDLYETFRKKGVAMVPGSFAGFDPKGSRVIFTGTQADQALVESLLDGGCGPCWSPALWVETDPASGGWGIACTPGGKGFLHGSSGEKELGFEIEATIGNNNTVIDVRYSIDLVEKLESRGNVTSSATLHSCIPQVIASRTLPGQDEQKVTLTARQYPREPETREGKPVPSQ